MKLLKISKKKGASLLEIVISMAILAIISIPIGGILITSVKTSKGTEDKQVATLMGQQILEEIRVTDFSNRVGINSDEVELTNGIKVKKVKDASDNLTGFNIVGSTKSIDGYDFDITITKDSNINFKENTTVNDSDATIFIKLNETNSNELVISNNEAFENNGLNQKFNYEISGNKLVVKNTVGKIHVENKSTSSKISFDKSNITDEIGSIRMYFINGSYFDNLEIDIDNSTTKNISVYLDKSKISSEDLDKDTNKIKVSTINGVMTLNHNVNTVIADDKKMGDVFKIVVKVYKNSKLLFEGDGITNIVSN